MAKQDFIPKSQTPYVNWHDTFLTQLTAQAATFGIAPAEVTGVQTQNGALHSKVTVATTADNSAKAAHADLSATISDSQATARGLARRIKAHPAYTPVIGDQMGLIGPDDTTDMTQQAPTLNATVKGGGVVEITFNKLNADGVHIYGQRDGDSGWVQLAKENYSPYVDNRPLLAAGKPETRKYKGIFVVADAEIGLESDVVEATARP